jgi:hypothetical protein
MEKQHPPEKAIETPKNLKYGKKHSNAGGHNKAREAEPDLAQEAVRKALQAFKIAAAVFIL